MAKHNPDLAAKYCEKTNYSSHRIQNEIIGICSKHVKDSIVQEIKNTGSFSIVCDEGTVILFKQFVFFFLCHLQFFLTLLTISSFCL